MADFLPWKTSVDQSASTKPPASSMSASSANTANTALAA